MTTMKTADVSLTDKDFAIMSGPDLVRWWNEAVKEASDHKMISYKPITKFETREKGAARCAILASSLRAARQSDKAYEAQEASSEASPATETVPVESPVSETEETDVAKKAKKAKKANAGNGATRTFGKPAKPVADFRPVRANTDRAKFLELADAGKMTIEQIASKLGKDVQVAGVIAYCLNRDNGIGYAVGEDRVVEIKYPGSKGLKDAIKQPTE